MNNLNTEILSAIDNIGVVSRRAEVDVITAIRGVCEKSDVILENHEGEDLSCFDIFQEGQNIDDMKNELKDHPLFSPEFKIAKSILEDIKNDTEEPVVNIHISRCKGDIKPTDSVIGCDKPPYAEFIPKSGNTKMRFLAQINCEHLKNLENFPHKGILQFWISDQYSDVGPYVVYYENTNNNKVDTFEFDNKLHEDDWPIEDGFVGRLWFRPGKQSMTIDDDRFGDLFVNAYNKQARNYDGVKQIKMFWDLPKPVTKYLQNNFPELVGNGTGHRINGYPAFTQSDPRYGKNKDKTIQLLQLDTEKHVMSWGDSGIAHFFISENDLKNRNFNNVLHYWDCY